MASVGWVEDASSPVAAPEGALTGPMAAVQERIRQQISKIGDVLCQVDIADGNPSFDLVEVASQNQAQMTSILQTVFAHLTHLDKQFQAEKQDAALGAVLKQVEEGLSSFKEQALGQMSSFLAECMKEDAAFLSGILEACTSCKREADHTRQVVLEHEAAMGSWGSTTAEAQGASKRLQAERDAQEASVARQRADLCAALESTSSEAALSMQHSLQVLECIQDTWRSSCEAFQVPFAELRAELCTISQELHTEARDLSAALMQRVLHAQAETERSLERGRSMEKEQEQSCQQLEEQRSLLRRATETEGLLRGQLAETQAAAAKWQEAAQHGMASGESSKLDLAEAHQAELVSLQSIIQDLGQQNEWLQAELQSSKEREEQHLIDIEQAHGSISDLREAAQQAAECQSAQCQATVQMASSYREGLRALHAFAKSELASMAHELARKLSHLSTLSASSPLGLTTDSEEPSSDAYHQEGKGCEGAGATQAALEALQEQLKAMSAECLEAQRLRDHWHSQYTAQAEGSVLAHMQLQRQCEAAAEECEQLRSQLDRQAAAAAEAQQRHAAELEASRSVAQQYLEAQQAELESLCQRKLNVAVSAACGDLKQQHEARLLERAAHLSALHAGKLGSMRDAQLLERQQLQGKLDEDLQRHLAQLHEERSCASLREERLIEKHATALQLLAGEHADFELKAAAAAEEHLQARLQKAEEIYTRQLEAQAELHLAQLAALQSSCAAELAEAKICLQKETREWQDRCNKVEARLQDSEQATAAQQAAHEKALGKMTAQHARKAAEAEQMQRAAAEMLEHHKHLAALEHDRHSAMLHSLQMELQLQSAAMLAKERQHEAELASRAADMAAQAQQAAAAQRQAAEGFRERMAAATAQHAQQLMQERAAAKEQAADADDRLQDVKDLLMALQARFNSREARPIDMEAIRALKETLRQRDEVLDELHKKQAALEVSRQQLQEEMKLREKNWLANGNMRVGLSIAGQEGLQGTSAGKAAGRKSSFHSGR